MLQQFGEHIRGWFAGIVLGVIAVAFVVWGLEYYISSSRGQGAAIAKVNGEVIRTVEFTNTVQQFQRQQEEAIHRALTHQEQTQMKQMVLNHMIQDVILAQAMHQLGLYVSPAVVQAVIRRAPEFQEQGQFSPTKFQSYLMSTGQSSAGALEASLQKRMMNAQLVGGLNGSAFVTPRAMQDLYARWQQRLTFRYAVLTPSVSSAPIKPEAIQSYYQAHQADFRVPTRVKVQFVQLSPKAIQSKVVLTNEAIRAYYEKHKANFMSPASWRIVRVTTKNTAQMAALQKQLKNHSLQALAKHPEASWQVVTQTLSADAIAPALIQALDQLAINQVSAPVDTPAGPTIFQLLSKKSAHVLPFAQVKSQLRAQLLHEKVQARLAALSDQLANLSYTHPNALEPVAKQTGLALNTSDWFSQSTASGVFQQPAVLEAVFSHDVLKGGDNSQPIALKSGGVIVLRVTQQQPGHAKALSAVTDTIRQTLQKQQALHTLGLRVYQLQSQLQKGQQSAALHWRTVKQVTRSATQVDPVVLSQAFKTPVGQVTSVATKNGFALVQVTSVTLGDWSKATPKQRQQFQMMLEKWQGSMSYQLLLTHFLKKADVVINNPDLKQSWSQ